MKFIKSYGQYLNENVNEAKKMRVKRKYGQYDATHVGHDGPTRNKILNFVSNEGGTISEQELRMYIRLTNEAEGRKTKFNWVKNNSRYLKKFENNGTVHYKLTALGKRVIKTNSLNELEDLEITESKKIKEGNAFSAARQKAIDDDKDEFEVDGKKFKVTGDKDSPSMESTKKKISEAVNPGNSHPSDILYQDDRMSPKEAAQHLIQIGGEALAQDAFDEYVLDYYDNPDEYGIEKQDPYYLAIVSAVEGDLKKYYKEYIKLALK